MNVYPAENFHFQPERQVLHFPVFSWLKQRLEAHRQKQADNRHIADLRTLDRHFLDDMGVDIAALGEVYPALASFVPPMGTTGESKNFFSLPVNMSSR